MDATGEGRRAGLIEMTDFPQHYVVTHIDANRAPNRYRSFCMQAQSAARQIYHASRNQLVRYAGGTAEYGQPDRVAGFESGFFSLVHIVLIGKSRDDMRGKSRACVISETEAR
jgi:hypothetical protein